MSTGAFFSLDHPFPDGFRISIDPRLSAGSLILLEPARDGLTGLPASWINYASDEAADSIVGASVRNFSVVNTLPANSAPHLVERSARGGLHVVVSQPMQAREGWDSYRIQTPAALLKYIFENPDHAYYFSASGRVTRNTTTAYTTGVGASYPFAGVYNNTGGSVESAFGVVQSNSTGTVRGRVAPAVNGLDGYETLALADTTPDPFFAYVATSGHEMTNLEAALGNYVGSIFNVGKRGPANDGRGAGIPSILLYSIYLEDLTVSGRTPAEVAAIDTAHTEATFAAGGRYDGDTWTSPASVT